MTGMLLRIINLGIVALGYVLMMVIVGWFARRHLGIPKTIVQVFRGVVVLLFLGYLVAVLFGGVTLFQPLPVLFPHLRE